LEELFNVKADVSSKVMLAAVLTLTMEDAQFFRVGLRGLENPPCLFVFPLSEIEHPNL
jgi:hypothetical protein